MFDSVKKWFNQFSNLQKVAMFIAVGFGCLAVYWSPRNVEFTPCGAIECTAPDLGDRAGALYGFGDGLFIMFRGLSSVFNSDIQLYRSHNTGAPYKLAYAFGMLMFGYGIFKKKAKVVSNRDERAENIAKKVIGKSARRQRFQEYESITGETFTSSKIKMDANGSINIKSKI